MRSIVDLAKIMGRGVCAEGVDTQRALEYLRSIESGKAKGYLFSKPIRAHELTKFVIDWNAPTDGGDGRQGLTVAKEHTHGNSLNR